MAMYHKLSLRKITKLHWLRYFTPNIGVRNFCATEKKLQPKMNKRHDGLQRSINSY
jgi:hypothetical protein